MGVGKTGVGEQGISQPEGRILFCLGNVTNLLPLATQSHIIITSTSSTLSSKIWLLSNYNVGECP